MAEEYQLLHHYSELPVSL